MQFQLLSQIVCIRHIISILFITYNFLLVYFHLFICLHWLILWSTSQGSQDIHCDGGGVVVVD